MVRWRYASCIEMGQINNVFLIVVITALMAVATAILAFLADIVPTLLGGNIAKVAGDSIAGAAMDALRH